MVGIKTRDGSAHATDIVVIACGGLSWAAASTGRALRDTSWFRYPPENTRQLALL